MEGPDTVVVVIVVVAVAVMFEACRSAVQAVVAFGKGGPSGFTCWVAGEEDGADGGCVAGGDEGEGAEEDGDVPALTGETSCTSGTGEGRGGEEGDGNPVGLEVAGEEELEDEE